MKNRQLLCIRCSATKSLKWYKGPVCNTCYVKEGYQRRKDIPGGPCKICGRTKSSTWNGKVCRSCHAKAHRLKPKSIEQLYNTFLTYTRNRKQIECNITLDQYKEIHNKPCYYCNKPIPHMFGGMDRIDNKKGYIIDNVLPCCVTCNKIRGESLTVDEMKFIMVKLEEFRKRKF